MFALQLLSISGDKWRQPAERDSEGQGQSAAQRRGTTPRYADLIPGVKPSDQGGRAGAFLRPGAGRLETETAAGGGITLLVGIRGDTLIGALENDD